MHFSKRMLRKLDCVKFLRVYCMTEIFESNSDVVQVKKNQDFVQPMVAFPISNISNCESILKLNL